MEIILNLLDTWNSSDSLTRIAIIIATAYLITKNVIKIPGWIKPKPKQHSDCTMFEDMNSVVNSAVHNAVEKCRKIIRIQEKETLREQMNYLEVAQEDITIKMLEDLRSLNPTADDILKYKNLIYRLEFETRGTIKKWFKENHYPNQSDEAYNIYIEEKTVFIISKIGQELDDNFTNYSIGRDQLKAKHSQSLIPYAKSQYRKVFIKAKAISEEKLAEIKKINEQYEE